MGHIDWPMSPDESVNLPRGPGDTVGPAQIAIPHHPTTLSTLCAHPLSAWHLAAAVFPHRQPTNTTTFSWACRLNPAAEQMLRIGMLETRMASYMSGSRFIPAIGVYQKSQDSQTRRTSITIYSLSVLSATSVS